MHILHILCTFCIFCAYYFAYYCAYFAYRTACILRIFWIYFAYLMHYILHIIAYYHRCILCTLCILYNAYCAYCAYYGWKVIHRVFRVIVYCHYCLVPHPRAQLFKYHRDHLQPSPLFADLSQKAPGKPAASRRMAKGIVPVAPWPGPTGTRGRRPSHGMEDTGITYKTCACSQHLYTIADWHWSSQTEVDKQIIRICKICKICRIWPDFRGPLYSSSTEK